MLSWAVIPKLKTKWNFSQVEFCCKQKNQWQAVEGVWTVQTHSSVTGRGLCSEQGMTLTLGEFLARATKGMEHFWVVSWALSICLHPEHRLIVRRIWIHSSWSTASPNENIYLYLNSSKKEIEDLFLSEHLWNTKYCFTGKWLIILLFKKMLSQAKNHHINCLQFGFVLCCYSENTQ